MEEVHHNLYQLGRNQGNGLFNQIAGDVTPPSSTQHHFLNLSAGYMNKDPRGDPVILLVTSQLSRILRVDTNPAGGHNNVATFCYNSEMSLELHVHCYKVCLLDNDILLNQASPSTGPAPRAAHHPLTPCLYIGETATVSPIYFSCQSKGGTVASVKCSRHRASPNPLVACSDMRASLADRFAWEILDCIAETFRVTRLCDRHLAPAPISVAIDDVSFVVACTIRLGFCHFEAYCG